jgi:hypothetical protein
MRPHLTVPKKSVKLAMLEPVEPLIREIRGERIILDADLARLYGVETKALNRAVKRNEEKFPSDFMFHLTGEEADSLRFQFGTLKTGRASIANTSLTLSPSTVQLWRPTSLTARKPCK